MSMLVGWGANEIVNQMNHARPRGSAAQQRDHTLTLAAKQQRLKDIRVDRMHVRVQHSIARVSKCCKYGERCKTTPVSRRARGQSGDRQPDENGYWHTITTKDQIPGWLRGNDYIVGGHPMPTHSYKRSFRLWRSLHMETMNIWPIPRIYSFCGRRLHPFTTMPEHSPLQPQHWRHIRLWHLKHRSYCMFWA
jgi:hypothetical protein